MPNPKEMDITRRLANGVKLTITLSSVEVENAYYKLRNLRLANDACRHLMAMIHKDIPDDDTAEQHIIDTYGYSVDDMCNPDSPHFAIEYLIDRFIQMNNENTAVAETWTSIITDYLNACKTSKQKAET